ncbi:MAG: hypothetical protein ACYC3L_01255 [Gemmatimonadaceae bacterium]
MRLDDTPPEAGTDDARAERLVPCPTCRGKGGVSRRGGWCANDPSNDWTDCPACEGEGVVPAHEAHELAQQYPDPADWAPDYPGNDPSTLEHGR